MSQNSSVYKFMPGFALGAALALSVVAASAHPVAGEPQDATTVFTTSSTASVLQTLRGENPSSVPVLMARHGADDGPGHDRGDRRGRRGGHDDPPGHADAASGGAGSGAFVLAQHGADDPAGDDHGRRGGHGGRGRGGHDDPPGHA
jgi:hypothetical protein